MKAQEIRQLTNQELNDKLASLKQELFNLRFANATGNLKNPQLIKIYKKDIAKILTILKERDIAGTK